MSRGFERSFWSLVPAAALVITCGCGKDPEVAKREYLASGDR